MPEVGNDERNTLLKQQFIEGSPATLKRELLQRPILTYEGAVKIAQQLDLTTVELTPELSSPNTDPNVNQMSVRRQPDTSYESAIVGQLKECVEALTEKVNQLSASVSNISEVATITAENPRCGRHGPCYNCGGVGHLSSVCRQTKRQNDRGQRQNENYCFVCG